MKYKNEYKNPWCAKNEPEFFRNDARLICEHRGIQVFKLFDKAFDYVEDGVCIAQRAGASKPKEVIDNILDGKDMYAMRKNESGDYVRPWQL